MARMGYVGPEITDAMVNAAARKLYSGWDRAPESVHKVGLRNDVREALKAALAVKP